MKVCHHRDDDKAYETSYETYIRWLRKTVKYRAEVRHVHSTSDIYHETEETCTHIANIFFTPSIKSSA